MKRLIGNSVLVRAAFTGALCLGVLGIVFTGIVAQLEKRLVPWAGAVDRD